MPRCGPFGGRTIPTCVGGLNRHFPQAGETSPQAARDQPPPTGALDHGCAGGGDPDHTTRGETPSQDELPDPPPLGPLGAQLGTRPLHRPAEGDEGRTDRFARPALQAEAHRLVEGGVEIDNAGGDGRHGRQPSPGRGRLHTGETERRAGGKAQPALDASGELLAGRGVGGDPGHHSRPGRRPGLSTRSGSNLSTSRLWTSACRGRRAPWVDLVVEGGRCVAQHQAHHQATPPIAECGPPRRGRALRNRGRSRRRRTAPGISIPKAPSPPPPGWRRGGRAATR